MVGRERYGKVPSLVGWDIEMNKGFASLSSFERFQRQIWPRIKVTDNLCWEWRGGTNNHGYGRFSISHKKRALVHRFVYLVFRPIPEGLTLDHLCRKPNCCNPAHLEPVTQRINILRGNAPSAMHARKTHCPKGHPYSGENLRFIVKGNGLGRYCRECNAAHGRTYKANKKAADPMWRRVQR